LPSSSPPPPLPPSLPPFLLPRRRRRFEPQPVRIPRLALGPRSLCVHVPTVSPWGCMGSSLRHIQESARLDHSTLARFQTPDENKRFFESSRNACRRCRSSSALGGVRCCRMSLSLRTSSQLHSYSCAHPGSPCSRSHRSLRFLCVRTDPKEHGHLLSGRRSAPRRSVTLRREIRCILAHLLL